MKILFSAFTIHPTFGSEPGVAWNWMKALARQGHEIAILTRGEYRADLAPALQRPEFLPNVSIHYFDIGSHRVFEKIWPLGERLHYLLWQHGAVGYARRTLPVASFDVVHHITLGTVRFPSHMGKLGIPFLLGPLGGGEATPGRLRKDLPFAARMAERLRNLSLAISRHVPAVRAQFDRADCILLRTGDGLALVGPANRHKAAIVRDVGASERPRPQFPSPGIGRVKFVFVGRLQAWKGLHLGIRGFAECLREFPEARLTVLGDGPEERRLRRLAQTLGCADAIRWLGEVSRETVTEHLLESDVLLFPSMHDSGGTVLLEAAELGRAAIVLDLGGPGEMVENARGWRIETDDFTSDQVGGRIGRVMKAICADPTLAGTKGAAAFAWSQTSTWQLVAEAGYREFEKRRRPTHP